MNKITFTSDSCKISLQYDSVPILNIIRITCNLTDKEWTSRLFNASIFVKISCYENENNVIATNSETVVFGGYISPYHKKPVLEINKFLKFTNDLFPEKYALSNRWIVDLELNNIDIKENEEIEVEYMDNEYIQKRIDDWKKRINDLYDTITQWLEPDSNFKIKRINDLSMYEELMANFNISATKIDSADIYYRDKLIFTFKPYGLWIIGANGRIDLINKSGNIILIDTANHFEKPVWKLHLKNTSKGYEFSKDTFLKLIAQ